MTSSTSWLEQAQQALSEKGFFELPDYEVGERIKSFQSQDFPYGTIFAVEALVESVIFDPRIRDIVTSYSDKVTLAHQLRYVAQPGRFFRFWPGGLAKFFVVHQWASGSTVEYWIGSHRVELPTLQPRLDNAQRKVKEPLPENTRESLLQTGCKAQEFHYPTGGLIITDARISFNRKQGYEFANVFFPNYIIEGRDDIPLMMLPYSPEMERKLRNMKEKSGNIGLNFAIRDPGQVRSSSSERHIWEETSPARSQERGPAVVENTAPEQ